LLGGSANEGCERNHLPYPNKRFSLSSKPLFFSCYTKQIIYYKSMRMFLLGVIVTLSIVNPALTKVVVVGVIDGIHCVYESTIGKLNNSAKS